MTGLMVRRALVDYARRPLNLVLLVVVPVVIVVVWSGQLAEFSKLLGGTAKPAHLEVATAGWAAAAVAGLAGFFQVSGSRATDRRLAAGSGRAAPIVGGRVGAAVVLAVAASVAAIVALAARAGIADAPRALSAVLLVAVIYVALGVVVGTLVRSEMNGALVVTVIWMLDVFLGPGIGTSSAALTRLFPLHFPTLVLTGQASGHAGPIGDVGWSLVWAAGLSVLAVARLAAVIRPAKSARSVPATAPTSATRSSLPTDVATVPAQPAPALSASPPAPPSRPFPAVARCPTAASARLAAALRAGAREYRRNHVLWALLVVVPVLFIAMAAVTTPTTPVPVALVDGARHFTSMISERQLHAAEMASIAAAFLAGLTGLFVVTGAAEGDRRLVLAGFRPREVLAGRLGIISGAALVTTAIAVAVSAVWLSPRQWAVFAGANLLIALTYAMVGVLLGPLTGRLGGLYLILLLAFIDVGFGQTVMFNPVPPTWGAFLPARGAGRLVLDGAFTGSFEQIGNLVLAIGWLVALSVAATLVFGRRIGSKLSPTARVTRLLAATPKDGASAPAHAEDAPMGTETGSSATRQQGPTHQEVRP